jgi:hypothetical protein
MPLCWHRGIFGNDGQKIARRPNFHLSLGNSFFWRAAMNKPREPTDDDLMLSPQLLNDLRGEIWFCKPCPVVRAPRRRAATGIEVAGSYTEPEPAQAGSVRRELLLRPGSHRWKGYGGDTDYQGATFETVTWACGLLAKTKRLTVFGTVHAPLIPPLIAAKQFVTADHIGEGRFGLNVVCGWNEGEFEMFGATLRDHETRYEYARYACRS